MIIFLNEISEIFFVDVSCSLVVDIYFVFARP